jgi:hypothetical protein
MSISSAAGRIGRIEQPIDCLADRVRQLLAALDQGR